MMINSANLNSLDFNLSGATKRSDLLPAPNLMSVAKLDTTVQYAIPQNKAAAKILQYNVYKKESLPIASPNEAKEPTTLSFVDRDAAIGERVKVQRLQTHATLQNNCWNYQNLRRFYTYNNSINGAIEQGTFCEGIGNDNASKNQSIPIKYNNNNEEQHVETTREKMCASTGLKRTVDQENAFRRIEDVHNYAKLNHMYSDSSSAESSRSSPHDYEDDDDDMADEDDEEDNKKDNISLGLRYLAQRKPLLSQSGQPPTVPQKPNNNNNNNNHSNKNYNYNQKDFHNANKNTDEDEEMHIDVETVPKEIDDMELPNNNDEEATSVEFFSPPDHHARRPMNAFLIFCKRHRAIVKERYKTLENR